jgi:hypothetical protein
MYGDPSSSPGSGMKFVRAINEKELSTTQSSPDCLAIRIPLRSAMKRPMTCASSYPNTGIKRPIDGTLSSQVSSPSERLQALPLANCLSSLSFAEGSGKGTERPCRCD